MGTDIIKEVAKRVAVEHFNNPNIIKELCTSDFTVHFSWGAEFKGNEKVIALLQEYKSNPRVVIDECFAESNKVVIRFRAFFQLEEGGEVIRNEIAIARFEGEKIAEWWAAFDRQSEKEQGGWNRDLRLFFSTKYLSSSTTFFKVLWMHFYICVIARSGAMQVSCIFTWFVFFL